MQDLGGKHILLVEDENGLQIAISLLLRQADYQVTVAESGREALNSIFTNSRSTRPINLLIIDLSRSVSEGDELLQSFDKAGIRLPVIVLLEYGADRGFEHPPADNILYISKPFEPQTLIRGVEDILRQNYHQHEV